MKLLTSLAAAVALAIAFASPASAKVCSGVGVGGPCGGTHGNEYTGALAGEGSLKVASSHGTLTCLVTLSGNVSNSATGAATITNLGLSACGGIGWDDCLASTTASSSNPWTATLTPTAAPNGTLAVSGFNLHYNCFFEGTIFFFTCRYTGNVSATIKGGKPAVLVFSGAGVNKHVDSSAICGNTATLTGEIKLKTPSSLYMT
jgi:hypothetical protein